MEVALLGPEEDRKSSPHLQEAHDVLQVAVKVFGAVGSAEFQSDIARGRRELAVRAEACPGLWSLRGAWVCVL